MPGLSSLLGSFIPLGLEPQLSRSFLFEVDGVPIGLFSEVQGLKVSIEHEKIKEGGQNSYEHHLPGRMNHQNIIFKRGLTQSDNLFSWFEKTSGEGFSGARNKLTRDTGAISVVNDFIRLRSWSLRDVFPVSWTGPSFSATDSSVLMEELEIAHHGFSSENLL